VKLSEAIVPLAQDEAGQKVQEGDEDAMVIFIPAANANVGDI